MLAACSMAAIVGYIYVFHFDFSEVSNTSAPHQSKVIDPYDCKFAKETASLESSHRQSLQQSLKDGVAASQYATAIRYMNGFNNPCLSKDFVVDIDRSKGMELLLAAANQGYKDAQIMLASIYEQGVSDPNTKVQYVAPDIAQAYFWGNLATNGQPPQKVMEKMTPEQLQAGKKLVSEWKPVVNETKK